MSETFSSLERGHLDPYGIPGNHIALHGYHYLYRRGYLLSDSRIRARRVFESGVGPRRSPVWWQSLIPGPPTCHVSKSADATGRENCEYIDETKGHASSFGRYNEDVFVETVREAREERGGEELNVGKGCTLLLFKRDQLEERK